MCRQCHFALQPALLSHYNFVQDNPWVWMTKGHALQDSREMLQQWQSPQLRFFLVLIQTGHAYFFFKWFYFPNTDRMPEVIAIHFWNTALCWGLTWMRRGIQAACLRETVVWHGAGGEEEVRFPLNTYQLLPFLESFSVVGKHRQVELKHSSGPRENFAGGFSAKQMVFPWSTPWAICLEMTNQKTWSFFLLGTC